MFNTTRVHTLVALLAMSLFSSLVAVSPVMAQATQVQGAIAPGSNSAQNPVAMGGADGSNLVRALRLSPSGILSFGATGNGQDGYTNSQLMYLKDIADVSGILPIAPMIYNPTSGNWDRQRFCESSVIVTLSGLTMTNLVNAVSGKSIYVCSVTVSGDGSSTAGAVWFATGTNSGCSTGQTALSTILRAPTFDSNFFGGNWGYYMITPASGYLCATNWTGSSTPIEVKYTIY